MVKVADGCLHVYHGSVLAFMAFVNSRQLHWQLQHESREHTWPMAANTADAACAAASLAPEAVVFWVWIVRSTCKPSGTEGTCHAHLAGS